MRPAARHAAVEPAGRQRRLPGCAPVLLVGLVVQVGWRIWLGRHVWTPIAHYDEDEYLLIARYLSGGAPSVLSSASPLRPIGYPLVISPLYWLTHDPVTIFRGAQGINAVLGASSFPFGYLAVRRWLGTPATWACAVAFVAALFPAATYYSSFALTESLFIPLLFGWLLCVQAWLAAAGERARTATAVGAGLVAGYAAISHVRGLVMAVLHVVLCLVVLARGPKGRSARAALASVAATAVVYLPGQIVGQRVGGILYPNGTWHAPVTERLSTPAGWIKVVSDGTGQLWYLSIGTWLFAALGIVVALRLSRAGTPPSVRVVMVLGLATTVLVAFATAAGIPGNEHRVNNHMQGRYILFTGPLWVVLGLAVVARLTLGRLLRDAVTAVVGTAAAGAVLLAYAGPRFSREVWVDFENPELAFLASRWQMRFTARDVLHVSLVSLACFAVLLAVIAVRVRRRPASWSVLLVAPLLALDVGAMTSITRNLSEVWWRDNEAAATPLASSSLVRPGTDVVAEARDLNGFVLLRHQREVWWSRVEQFDARGATGPPNRATVLILPGDVDAGRWNSPGHTFRRVAVVEEPTRGVWAVWRRSPS